jgi:hypothetical protein
MGTAGRSAPLRRTGSLLGLLGLEVAAVLALHALGRVPGLRIRWEEPVPWLLSSPVQEVLGAVLRTVGLVMAYWLLASTLVYLLASLTRLPAAVRAVSWATLPLVRRVADHAVAVTLATSMVGGGTLGMAGPVAAATDRGGSGPPARTPAAAAQATSSSAPQDAPSASAGEATEPSRPRYVPNPAAQVPTSTTAPEATTTTAETTTSTQAPTTTTQAPTTTTAETTTTTQAPTTTTQAPTTTTTTAETTTTTQAATTTTRGATTTTTGGATRPSPPSYVPEPAGQAPTRRPVAGPTSTDPTTGPTAPTRSTAATTSTTGLRPPAYEFTPAGSGAREAPGDPGSGNNGGENNGGENNGGDEQPGPGQEQAYRVERGDNLWAIARNHLARARSGGSGEPTNREVAHYWLRLVEANKDGLRSGDPDLIYPDEEITLPPVD